MAGKKRKMFKRLKKPDYLYNIGLFFFFIAWYTGSIHGIQTGDIGFIEISLAYFASWYFGYGGAD